MVEKDNILKEVFAFVGIAFLLLGVLFGMQIMTFIFGNLGTTTSSFDAALNPIINETGFINQSGYTLVGASDVGFANPSISLAKNATSDLAIGAGNFTVNTTTGIVRNITNITWSSVNFTYTYNSDSIAKITADAVTNNSLTSIATYTAQADTQFNTTAIAITLLVLIALFGIFWRVFMSKGGMSGDGGGNDKNFA